MTGVAGSSGNKIEQKTLTNKKKKEQEKAAIDAKRAPTSTGPYIPTSNKKKKDKKKVLEK